MNDNAHGHEIDPAADLDGEPGEALELQFLSCVLFARGPLVQRVVAQLRPTDFYNPVHAQLFTVISDLITAGDPHDSAMVLNSIARQGKAHGHAGQRLTQALTLATVAGAPAEAVEAYGGALLSQAYRRSFHLAAQRLATIAAEAAEDQLYDQMCILGREQRDATERLTNYRNAQHPHR